MSPLRLKKANLLKCLSKEEIKAYGGKAIMYSAKFHVKKRGIFPSIWGLKFPVSNLTAAKTIFVQLGLFYIDANPEKLSLLVTG